MTHIQTNTTNKRVVALAITELSPGGAEKALVHLATSLDRARFTPIVYTLSGLSRDTERSLAPVLRSHGIEVVELGVRGIVDALPALWRLARDLRARRVTILQTFMYHANIFGRIAGRLAGVPLICSGVRVAERDAPLRLKFDRLTRRFVDAWLCVGDDVAAFTCQTLRAPSSHVFSIPNGVDLELVQGRWRVNSPTRNLLGEQSPLTPPEGFARRKRMVVLGRLAPQKGIDWLLEHATLWLTPEIRNSWELWLLGDGPQRESLQSLCHRLGLEDFVWFAGWRADATDILADSQLLLLPSRWEGMSNSLLEAAGLGVATMCHAVEGVEQTLGPHAAPQICYDRSAREWADKITALLTNDDLREEMANANQARVLELFSVEKIARRYESTWTQLLRAKGYEIDEYDARGQR